MTQALTKVSDTTEVALPPERIEAVRDAIASARSERTREAYRWQFDKFTDWCEEHDRAAVPCSIETLAAYITALQDGTATGRQWAPSSIEQALSAVIVANRLAGNSIERKASIIAEAVKGVKAKAAKRHKVRKVRPMKVEDIQTLLEMSAGDRLIDIRDDAILGIGFAGALRRSEIVGLDLEALSDGTGVLNQIEAGVEITLMTSKASQAENVVVALPCETVPAICDAIGRWIEAANIEPGQPVFQSIGKGQSSPTGTRLQGKDIARIIKRRMTKRLTALYISRGAKAADAKQRAETEAKNYAGHSLRSGLITSLAEAGLATHSIQEHSRHKTANLVKEYVRDTDKWNASPLATLKM